MDFNPLEFEGHDGFRTVGTREVFLKKHIHSWGDTVNRAVHCQIL